MLDRRRKQVPRQYQLAAAVVVCKQLHLQRRLRRRERRPHLHGVQSWLLRYISGPERVLAVSARLLLHHERLHSVLAWILLPRRIDLADGVRRWLVLRHSEHAAVMCERQLLRRRINLADDVRRGLVLRHTELAGGMRERQLLPRRLYHQPPVPSWLLLCQHHLPATLSSRLFLRLRLNVAHAMPRQHLLTRQRERLHAVPLSLCIGIRIHPIHRLQLSLRDRGQRHVRDVRELRRLPRRLLLQRRHVHLLILCIHKLHIGAASRAKRAEPSE